jgi:hypothetical protein
VPIILPSIKEGKVEGQQPALVDLTMPWQSMTGTAFLPLDLPAVRRAKQKDIVEKYVV